MKASGHDVAAEEKFLPVVTRITDRYSCCVAMVTTETISINELNQRKRVKVIKTYKNTHCHKLNNVLGFEQFSAESKCTGKILDIARSFM
jgi:hypothetical protein